MGEQTNSDQVDNSLLDQFQDDFSLFIEAGFVAVKQLDEVSANRLFHAAHLLQSKSVAPNIGMGYIALNKLEIKRATEIFTEVLQMEPDHHLAQTFLAICHLLKKASRDQGKAELKKIEQSTDDPTIVNLCKTSLKWAEKDLSGGAAPFFQPAE